MPNLNEEIEPKSIQQHKRGADAAMLQQIILSGHKELVQKQPPRNTRKLFRYLRELVAQE